MRVWIQKKANRWSFLFLVAALFCFSSVWGAAPDMPCKDFVAEMTKQQMEGIKECSKSMKFKDAKEKSAKMNCIIKCVMIKKGLLNSEGVFDVAMLGAMLDQMPGNLLEKGAPMFEKCGKDSVGVLDPKEENCKSYSTMVTCLMGLVGKLCK